MLADHSAKTFQAFWESFMRDPLYETGFCDAISGCGAHKAETWEREADAAAALGFLNGYAQASRVCCDYMSVHWQICNLLAIAAGIQGACLSGDVVRCAARMADTWTRELTELCVQKRALPAYQPARWTAVQS